MKAWNITPDMAPSVCVSHRPEIRACEIGRVSVWSSTLDHAMMEVEMYSPAASHTSHNVNPLPGVVSYERSFNGALQVCCFAHVVWLQFDILHAESK